MPGQGTAQVKIARAIGTSFWNVVEELGAGGTVGGPSGAAPAAQPTKSGEASPPP